MMMNIFSIFDPSTSLMFSLNWFSLFIILLIFPYNFWLINSRFNHLSILILSKLYMEFKLILKFSYANLLIFLSFFIFILYNNFMGLFPYIFTASSHLSFCFFLSLNLWFSIMLFLWINFFYNVMIHLVPMNTPMFLMPLMVMIEFISLMIRPLTLSIRLTANMISGHLLLTLIGSSGLIIKNFLMINLVIFIQILLYILEISVSLIQAYVFSILSLLYSNE